MITRFTLLLLAFVFMAVPADAQNWRLTPTFGTYELSEGFLPDPMWLDVQAGGTIDMNAGDCDYGYVANAPDIDINYYTSGGSSLYFYSDSSYDTTLLIYTPDGRWICNDDGGAGSNAMVYVHNAPRGNYNVWIGTYNRGNQRARFFISERDLR